jgi:excisionase family DNA binding protein
MSRKEQMPTAGSGAIPAPVESINLPLVLTKQQLATILGCTTRHLDNLTRRGLLPAVHLGRLVRYRREAVLRALANLEDRLA